MTIICHANIIASQKAICTRVQTKNTMANTLGKKARKKTPGQAQAPDITDAAAPLPIEQKTGGAAAPETSLDVSKHRKEEEERRALELKMTQIQRDESLAFLAGSVAHDFNNMLTAINGYAAIIEDQIISGASHEAIATTIKEIGNISQQAKELCAELMAYSGRGQTSFSPVNLNSIIRDMSALLRISVSKTAALKIMLPDLLSPIMGDGSQIRQIIMNLIINASDALKGKPGTIRLTTSFTRSTREPEAISTETAATARNHGHVVLEVKDTGCGMTDEVKAKIFEPFYSTKANGRGLGMAAVAGILRSHNASITVDSIPRKGTVIRIYFPVASEPAK